MMAVPEAAGIDVCFEQAALALRPDPDLSVSEWADRYRMLSQKAASEPGPWRTERTPYLEEIMDCLSASSPVRRVVLMKGSQLGGTECGNCWIGYVIHQAPGPMMAVAPTVELAKRNSKQRIDPLIEESAALKRLVKERRSRDSGNTVLSKEFPGGVLVMTGANSAVGLRSMPVRYLFLDEVDGYPGDVEGEGDPIALAEARSRTFVRRKVLLVSTPTIAGLSRIEREYEASDRRRYFVPCPACGAYQTLEFAQLKWEKGKPETARYECAHCGAKLGDEHKTRMLARGEWRATRLRQGSGGQAAQDPGSKVAGFHLSSLYSPVGWLSWVEIAQAWVKAQGHPDLLKSFVNTVLGETWAEEREAPDWQRLYDRCEDYSIGTVPWGGLFLTAGVDVQKDRLEVSVWAWGREKESWLVEHRVLAGDTSRPEVWRGLTAMLGETWPHESGVDMALVRTAVDSGYATQEVYAWARRQPASRVIVVKGVERAAAPVGQPSAVDVTRRGKRIRRGARVWPVCGPIYKSELYGWLRQERPTEESGDAYPPGYVHLPKIGEEFCRQLVAEHLVTRTVKGYRKDEWEQTRERNEALDCRVYARAAAAVYGLDRFGERRWRELERAFERKQPNETGGDVPRAVSVADRSMPAPRDAGWLGGRRGDWMKG